MKNEICLALISILGGWIATLFGGWSTALNVLMIFMTADYITGLVVAGVFHNSKKTDTGALESRAGWKGLCRKGGTLLVVLIAAQLDLLMHSTFIRDAVVIYFVGIEGISILENLGLMGVKIPKFLSRMLDVLIKKSENIDEKEGE